MDDENDPLGLAELSESEVLGMAMRELRCPKCGFRLGFAFADARTGHISKWCRKCKQEYVLNLAYFRKARK